MANLVSLVSCFSWLTDVDRPVPRFPSALCVMLTALQPLHWKGHGFPVRASLGHQHCHVGSSWGCREMAGNGTKALPSQGTKMPSVRGREPYLLQQQNLPAQGEDSEVTCCFSSCFNNHISLPLCSFCSLPLCPPILCCCHLGAVRQENHRRTISPGQKHGSYHWRSSVGLVRSFASPFWTCLATTKWWTADRIHPQWNRSQWYSGWLQTHL